MAELKQFNKVYTANDVMGLGCDGLTCECTKDLNIKEEKEEE